MNMKFNINLRCNARYIFKRHMVTYGDLVNRQVIVYSRDCDNENKCKKLRGIHFLNFPHMSQS